MSGDTVTPRSRGRSADDTGPVVRSFYAGCLSSTLLVAAAACVTHREEKSLPPAAILAAQGIECHKERATGTLVAATVCTSAAERARAADNTRQSKDWLGKKDAGPCPPTGPCH